MQELEPPFPKKSLPQREERWRRPVVWLGSGRDDNLQLSLARLVGLTKAGRLVSVTRGRTGASLTRMTRPRVVCFDLGGVLVRIARSWVEACERAGVVVHDREELSTEAAIQARRPVMMAYQSGDLSTPEYYEGLRRALGGRYSLEEVASVHDAWLLEEYAGVAELVTRLGEVPGVQTACLSNTNERHWEMLAPERGPARFPAVQGLQRRFASHLMRVSKPEARIFEGFQAALAARPEDILFFDDGEPNVSAARRLGWRAETIDPTEQTLGQLESYLRRYGIDVG